MRLNGVVPEGFRLTAEDQGLVLRIHGTWDSRVVSPEIVEDESRDLGERLETTVFAALDSIQDSVTEYLRIPWPSADGRSMAEPGVRYDGDAIHLWYGDSEKAAVLGLSAIPLSEVVSES